MIACSSRKVFSAYRLAGVGFYACLVLVGYCRWTCLLPVDSRGHRRGARCRSWDVSRAEGAPPRRGSGCSWTAQANCSSHLCPVICRDYRQGEVAEKVQRAKQQLRFSVAAACKKKKRRFLAVAAVVVVARRTLQGGPLRLRSHVAKQDPSASRRESFSCTVQPCAVWWCAAESSRVTKENTHAGTRAAWSRRWTVLPRARARVRRPSLSFGIVLGRPASALLGGRRT